VLGLINGERFGNSHAISGIGILPSGFLFNERDSIWPIAVDLIGGHMNKRRFRAVLTCSLKKIQRPNGVRIKVVKRDGGSPIMRRLCCRMDDTRRTDRPDQIEHTLTIAYVQLMMLEIIQCSHEPSLAPAGISLRTEKNRSLVIVNTMYVKPAIVEESSNVGAYKP
jgi:hypothetical protein